MTIRLLTALILTAMLLPVMGGAAPTLAANGDPLINEFVFNHTGTDTNEFIEVFGAPDTDYSALTVLEVEGDGGGAGRIDGVFTVGTTDAGGFWATDFLNNELENGTVTLLLVEAFTGGRGDDLDSNNDGNLDSMPWDRIVDDVAVTDGGSSDRTYSSVVLAPGFDGNSFTPGGASRIPNGVDTDMVDDWVRNDFDGAGLPIFIPGTPVPVTIMEIQGDGQFSDFDGDLVETSGIVTLFTSNRQNFWLQDPIGDSDAATSDGIFVVVGSPTPEALNTPEASNEVIPPLVQPEVGDLIRIIARVQEQQFEPALPLTRLLNVELIEVLSSGNPLPAPVELNDLPDVSIVDGIAFWEPLEGMLVSVQNAPVVAATSGFGEFAMLAKDDAKPGSGFFPETQQILLRSLGPNDVDYNPERILVDDSTLDEAIIVMPGDRVRSLVGAVDYTFGNYKLQPAGFEINTHDLPNLPASTRSGPTGDVVIITYNVENLFDLLDDPGKDDIGTGGASTEADLDVQLAKLALSIEVELANPDIIVLQEVEKTEVLTGDQNGLVPGTSIPALIPRLQDNWDAVSFDTSDGRGIEVAFMWRPGRVNRLDAFQITEAIVPGTDAAFGGSSPSPGREPLVGMFQVEGKTITIIGNHFKSKSGDDPLFGVNQPPIRITEVQRKAQATVVRNYVNSILDGNPGALVMVTGDLNDFQFGEPGEGPDHPIAILESGGDVPLTNLLNLEKDDERYTFVFDGNSQVLDHMLVSPALFDLFVGVDVLHFNAGFSDDLEGDPSTTLRASDHDPLEGRFSLK